MPYMKPYFPESKRHLPKSKRISPKANVKIFYGILEEF